MTNIGFQQPSDAQSFGKKKRDEFPLRSGGLITYAIEKTNEAGIRILLISRTSEVDSITGVCLVSNSNDPAYPIDKATASINQQVNTLLDNVGEPPVNVLAYNFGGKDENLLGKPQHRAFFVSKELRGKGAGKLLHDTMDKVDGEHREEFTFVPSLLMFYLKHGFSISAIHMKIEGQEDLVKYDNLSEQQKQIIYNSVVLASRHDFSLPFYVELEKTKEGNQYEDKNMCPEELLKFLFATQMKMGEDGNRLEPVLSEDTQKEIERGFGLDNRSGDINKIILLGQTLLDWYIQKCRDIFTKS